MITPQEQEYILDRLKEIDEELKILGIISRKGNNMKKRTRWKRAHPNIIGKRFFDAGEFGLGFFTVLKAWKCKEYCESAIAPDGTRWFDKQMILIKTDSGIKYKIPYCPWMKLADAETGKAWDSYYNERPW